MLEDRDRPSGRGDPGLLELLLDLPQGVADRDEALVRAAGAGDHRRRLSRQRHLGDVAGVAVCGGEGAGGAGWAVPPGGGSGALSTAPGAGTPAAGGV